MAKVMIPTPLRKYTQNTTAVEVRSNTVGASLKELVTAFPELQKHLLDEQGKVRFFINIFVGDQDIRSLENDETPVDSETVIHIVPAIAGGIPAIFTKQ